MDDHGTADSRKGMPRHRIHVQELHVPPGNARVSRMSRRVTLALLLVAAVAVAAFFYGPHAISVAQQQQRPAAPPAAVAPPAVAQQQQQKKAPEAPTTPQRIETVIYDAWTVVCQDTLEKSSRKTCSALNRVVEQKSQQVVFVWQMNTDAQGKLIARLQTPTGVQIQRGVEVKLGDANARRFMFTVCDTRACQAEAIVEDQLLREAAAAPEGTVTVILRDGRGLQFKLSMKGFDKAIASLLAGR